MQLLGPQTALVEEQDVSEGSREEGSGEGIEKPAEDQTAMEQPAEEAPLA